MINWLIMAAGIVLVSYDPAMRLLAYVRGRMAANPVIEIGENRPSEPKKPTRMEAFTAAETLVAYYRSIGHDEAAASANEAAQKLFTEPPAK